MVSEGDAKLKQYAIEAPLGVLTDGDAQLAHDAASLLLLTEAKGRFMDALMLDPNNIRARSGQKRADALVAEANRCEFLHLK